MLYVTATDKYDACTAARSLSDPKGIYLPYKMPKLTAQQIASWKDESFGQTVAGMLNLFFSAGLSGWDVEFLIGRNPVKLSTMGQKVTVAEMWRNLEGSYEKLERLLAGRICDCFPSDVKLTSWLRIAVRISMLAGTFGILQRQGSCESVDIAVPEDDFSLPMAVWYARVMGMPIVNIIIGCADGSDAWNLIHTGGLRSPGPMKGELERLIRGTLGVDEVLRFRSCADRGAVYSLLPYQLSTLRNGVFAAVVSRERLETVVPNVYRTTSYRLEPGAAAAYSALLDYRAKTGESRMVLLMADTKAE